MGRYQAKSIQLDNNATALIIVDLEKPNWMLAMTYGIWHKAAYYKDKTVKKAKNLTKSARFIVQDSLVVIKNSLYFHQGFKEDVKIGNVFYLFMPIRV